MMNRLKKSKIETLIQKGVNIPNPDAVDIGEDVDIKRMSAKGVTIHTGCRLFGKRTLILDRTTIGYEGPATVDNCQVGPEVDLKSGFFSNAVFLRKVSMGAGSHVRTGTILEEEAKVAHTVGLKHTILFPFVTLGSLINFCDCFMTGGTDGKNHSEVGSSYIHFNYTPNQDKATASLLGDVPNGVMLNQPPIFLGGQGGLVGPCRVAFGITIAAGTIFRKDELRNGRLIFGGRNAAGNVPYTKDIVVAQKRTKSHNIDYIANLMTLMQWYRNVRVCFISTDFPNTLLEGLQEKLLAGIQERIVQLKGFYLKNSNDRDAYERWAETENFLLKTDKCMEDKDKKESFLKNIESKIQEKGKDYISVIQGLEQPKVEAGIDWLQGIVDRINYNALQLLNLK